jgi:hypothetical protein
MFAVCLQTWAARIPEGGDQVDDDRVPRQPTLHRTGNFS